MYECFCCMFHRCLLCYYMNVCLCFQCLSLPLGVFALYNWPRVAIHAFCVSIGLLLDEPYTVHVSGMHARTQSPWRFGWLSKLRPSFNPLITFYWCTICILKWFVHINVLNMQGSKDFSGNYISRCCERRVQAWREAKIVSTYCAQTPKLWIFLNESGLRSSKLYV